MAQAFTAASKQTTRPLEQYALQRRDQRLPKRCLAIIHSTTFGKKQTQYITTKTSYQHAVGGGVMIWVCFPTT